MPSDPNLQQECEELSTLAERLAAHAPRLAPVLETWRTELRDGISACSNAAETERRLEHGARALREIWLRGVAVETASVLRSPTDAEAARVAQRHDSFGYERDFQPEELEARCEQFFAAPPQGWTAEHVLFSSGQSALTCALLTAHGARPLRVAHLGRYFETRKLLETHPSLGRLNEGEAELVILEPVTCDGEFARCEPDALQHAMQHARIVVIDSTLLGRADDLNAMLTNVREDALVLRLISGLKLLQGGLELANVGILSIYARNEPRTRAVAARLRETRTLTGAGLRFADALALEAPWFLDANYTKRYEDAVFAHNAALAYAVAQNNHLFAPVTHPALDTPPGLAPYCVFQLKTDDAAAYERLNDLIASEVEKRDLLFERGGSFGFRGHRYDLIEPETGQPRFLRVAMGRRGGWSCDGIVQLFAEIAQRPGL